MGVDTKVLLTDPPSVLELMGFIATRYKEVSLRQAGISEDIPWYWMSFNDGNDKRQLSVFPPELCSTDYDDVHDGPAMYISMGRWGNSVLIARRIAKHFGGFIMPNDCTDAWRYVPKIRKNQK